MASHYLRKNGTYCVRSYYGVHNGVQKIVSKTYYPPAGMSQKAVEKDLARFEKRFDELVRSGEYVPGAKVRLQDTRSCYMTVKMFIEDYYRVRMERDLSPNTVRFYDSIIRQFIIPSFGEIRLIDIRKEHLQRFVDYLAYKLKGEKQALKAPKSLHGNRTVFFPDSYKKILLDWKCEQEEQQKKSKKVDKQDNFVFTNPDGGMISVYTPTRICQKFEEKHGMRHLKLHGLRHTFGSIMIAMGTDPETVRDMMGHDSVKTTDIYLHPYDVNKKKAAERFGSLIEGDKNAADDLTKSS